MSAVMVDLPVGDASSQTPQPAKPARKRVPRKAPALPAPEAPCAAADALLPELLAAHTVHAAPEPAAPLAPVASAASTFHAWAERPGRAAMDELCAFIVGQGTGGHLAAFARSRGFAALALLDWIQADPERAARYARAREERADILADEITEIADAPAETAVEVARSRLRVEARKWVAARLKPRAYGDRLAVGGAGDLPPVAHVHEMSDEALLAIAQGVAARTGKGRNP